MKVVLALHGFLGLPSDWNEVQREYHRLQSDAKLVPVDYMNLRGLTPDVSLERWGENFCLWAERKFPRTQLLIAGYSQGGRLALQALHAKPALWSNAIFLSTNPGLSTENEKLARRESDLKWADRFQSVDFQTVLREWNAQPVFANSKTEPLREAKNYHPEALAGALRQWSLGRQQDFSKTETLQTVPNLWLAGEQDKKFVDLANRLIADSPGVATRLVPGAGHRLIFDQPELVATMFFEALNFAPTSIKISKQI